MEIYGVGRVKNNGADSHLIFRKNPGGLCPEKW